MFNCFKNTKEKSRAVAGGEWKSRFVAHQLGNPLNIIFLAFRGPTGYLALS